MGESIHAIETLYDGYRFRSRLEARWAVFFNALKMKYIYEPEGFRFSDGTMYLPDFFLPETKTFFEVKGILDELDLHKVNLLALESRKPVVIGKSDFHFQCTDAWAEDLFEITGESDSWLAKCHVCGKPYFLGSNGSYYCRSCGAYDGDGHFSVLLDGDGDPWRTIRGKNEAQKAIELAKQARFEHGETPEVINW